MENNNPQEVDPENNTGTIFTEEEFSLQGYDKHIRQARNTIFFCGRSFIAECYYCLFYCSSRIRIFMD